MITTLQSMKEFGKGFQVTFKKDDDVMKEMQKRVQDSVAKTRTENQKIQDQIDHVRTGFFQRIMMLLSALAIFVFMFIFIRMFPSRKYH